MDISKTLFATMVKNARMDRHWTQEELAEKLSVFSSNACGMPPQPT